jgi:hypothetical protein
MQSESEQGATAQLLTETDVWLVAKMFCEKQEVALNSKDRIFQSQLRNL